MSNITFFLDSFKHLFQGDLPKERKFHECITDLPGISGYILEL